MTCNDNPSHATPIACEICLTEVPLSEATIAEASDYFLHLCGIACCEKWKLQSAIPDEPSDNPGV